MTRTQGLIGAWGAMVASLVSVQIHPAFSIAFLLIAAVYLYGMIKAERTKK